MKKALHHTNPTLNFKIWNPLCLNPLDPIDDYRIEYV